MLAECHAGLGEEQLPHACELFEGCSAAELLALVTIRPFVVAGKVDHRVFELLELVVDRLVPARRGGRDGRQDPGAGARHAAGVDVANVYDQAHVAIGVNGVDEQMSVVEQVLAVGPIAENRQGDGLRSLPVVAVAALVVVGERCRGKHGNRGERECR